MKFDPYSNESLALFIHNNNFTTFAICGAAIAAVATLVKPIIKPIVTPMLENIQTQAMVAFTQGLNEMGLNEMKERSIANEQQPAAESED